MASYSSKGRKVADKTGFSSGKEISLVPAPCCLVMYFIKPQEGNSPSFPITTPNNKKPQACWTLRETNVSTSLENTAEACGHPAFLRRLWASSPACLPSRAASSGGRTGAAPSLHQHACAQPPQGLAPLPAVSVATFCAAPAQGNRSSTFTMWHFLPCSFRGQLHVWSAARLSYKHCEANSCHILILLLVTALQWSWKFFSNITR